ncbi:MAG: maleylpyruvate isomerase family mycothiol-dependent enzyme [Nocardioidaceae bacterium]|nr:maleylpyruvate isomerase family mycothiol-dependent enzyme [Nocardioidaceae bacterium]
MIAPLRLQAADYVGFVGSESARFTDLLADVDPTSPVPACPEWDAGDLLWHLLEVQWFWGSVAGRRLNDPGPAEQDKPERPGDHQGLVALARQSTDRLVSALLEGDASDPIWTWLEQDQTRGFIQRRQAHEALIHRVDAEQVAGAASPLDAPLATDGVDEALRIMFGGTPGWGTFHWGAGPVAVAATDTGARWVTEVGRVTGTDPEGDAIDEPSLEVHDGRAADPVAQLSGHAAVLDSWLWGRLPTSAVDRSGDAGALAAFDAVVGTGVQ